MCDYSLAGVPNRLAVQGETLLVHRFRTGSVGLAAPPESPSAPPKLPPPVEGIGLWQRIKDWFAPAPLPPERSAVCIPPGARLQIAKAPDAFLRTWDLSEGDDVRFTQLSQQVRHHRDAIEVSSGRMVLLQYLPLGMSMLVLSLGGNDEDVASDEESMRESLERLSAQLHTSGAEGLGGRLESETQESL